MKIKLTLVLTFLINLLTYCQDLPKLIQPSPEAANLSRYADVPVSLYTGKPQISFPLHTLKCGSLELPISLSYYASGVKVEDYPTWAGIGWAINAGGVITSIESSTAKDTQEDIPITGSAQERYDKLTNFVLPGAQRNVIYHYNFLQYSGSFQEKDNKGVLRKQTNLKIVFSIDRSMISVTDDNGNNYYFELKSSVYDIQKDYYLVKIESANKINIINFEYIRGDSYPKDPHISKFYALHTNGVSYLKDSEGDYTSKFSGLLLSRIYTSNNDSVEFIKKDIYQLSDSNSPYGYKKALDSINLFHNSSKLSAFHFKTNNVETTKTYSGPYPNQSPQLNWGTTEMNYRLYLDGFDKIDSEGNITESHGFEYYGRTIDGKDLLPNRFSRAQDLGGYYNGQDSNTTLIPPLNQTLMPDQSGLTDGVSYNDSFAVSVNIPGANRNPNLEYMQMGTLKSIKYPTGGFTKFYYSQMENPLTSEPYYGLKIDKIEYFNTDGSLQRKKKYIYQYPVLGSPIPSNWHYTLYNDYDGLLIAPFQTICELSPYDNSFLCEEYNSKTSFAIQLSPDPVNNLELNEGPMIGYQSVTEFDEGNGRIEYQFSTDGAFDEKAEDHFFQVNHFRMHYNIYNIPYTVEKTVVTKNSWPTGPFASNWKMGTLLNKSTFGENGVLKEKVQYHYTHDILGLIPAINIFGVRNFDAQVIDQFYYQEFAYVNGWERLDSITETIDNVTKVTNYTYDAHKQVSQISTTKSNGDNFTTNFTYPYSYSSNVYSNMVSRNIIAPVIEKTEKINNNQVKLLKTNYSFWKPDTSSNNLNMMVSNDVTNHIYPLSVEVQSDVSPIETRLNYNSYDNKGNITSVSKAKDAEAIYIWGYNSRYPIAKIENATYSQVSSQVANLQLKSNQDNDRQVDIIDPNGSISYQGNEGALRSALTDLRNSLSDAMVTTYTYDPLIGITSITDPKGYTIYYEYDAFNRLKQVKDAEGKIISNHQYNYKQ